MRTLKRFAVTLVAALCLTATSGMADEDGGVLVLGGTGDLGVRIVRSLVEAGNDVTVFVRPTSDRSSLDGLDVDYAIGDLTDEASVIAAFEDGNFRAVVNAVRADIDIEDFYLHASRAIAKGAQAGGVQQIIHHGAVGAGSNMNLHPDVPWGGVPGLVDRMLDHGAAEEVFFSTDIPTTIIRNSRVWPDSTPATGNAVMTEDRNVLTPITRIDLARFTMECLDNTDCYDKVFHNKDETLTWPAPGMGGEE